MKTVLPLTKVPTNNYSGSFKVLNIALKDGSK